MATVFDFGKIEVKEVRKNHKKEASSPPKSLLVVTPREGETGKYPVVLFLHGFWLQNSDYLQVLRHVASHGFIFVAPQLFEIEPLPPVKDIAAAAAVCNWLPEGLKSLLPEGVTADLAHLGLSGHSCGGYEAFSLALGLHAKTSLKFSALIGVDPVAEAWRSNLDFPRILSYVHSSFPLDFPVLVFGTGLGSQRNSHWEPPCAREGVNHSEFYNESRPPCYYLVAKDYGHLDMLDDGVEKPKWSCKCGDARGKDAMRRTTAGVITAFLKAYLCGEKAELDAVVGNPGLAPTTLDPVEYRLKPAPAVVNRCVFL